jgi:hypothetical protein
VVAHAPGTTCTLHFKTWAGKPPEDGDFLRTPAGSCYRIDRVRGKTLHCTRLEHDAVRIGDPGVHWWVWNAR